MKTRFTLHAYLSCWAERERFIFVVLSIVYLPDNQARTVTGAGCKPSAIVRPSAFTRQSLSPRDLIGRNALRVMELVVLKGLGEGNLR